LSSVITNSRKLIGNTKNKFNLNSNVSKIYPFGKNSMPNCTNETEDLLSEIFSENYNFINIWRLIKMEYTKNATFTNNNSDNKSIMTNATIKRIQFNKNCKIKYLVVFTYTFNCLIVLMCLYYFLILNDFNNY
jgi:hypothetical protein